MNSLKETKIKNRTDYFFDDIINFKGIDLDRIRIGKRSINIKYIHSKNIRYVNPLYFIIDQISRYIEGSNGDKYLALVSIGKDKDVIEIYKNCEVKLKV